MRRLTIGSRLTLWYGVVLAVGLCAFAGVVYSSFARNLLSEVDRALAEELAEIASVVRDASTRDELVANLQRSFGQHEFYQIQVSGSDATIVFHTPALAEHRLPVPEIPSVEQSNVNAELPGLGPFRVATQVSDSPSGAYVIQAADSLRLFRRELRGLLAVMLGAGPIVLGLALAGGYWLSRRALRPVDRMTAAAIELSAARLDRRVAVENSDDELGRLAHAFNGMLERLQRSFDEMRRFTADAAHELRTPLAVLRNEAEVALRAERPPEQYRHVLELQLEEIARLTRLAEELLFLCREDAGLQKFDLRPVRVDEVLTQLVGQLQTAAQARDVSLEIEAARPCTVPSDPDRLRRLFFNLIDNALKYTPAHGKVRLACTRHADAVQISVTDTGIGIPAEHLPLVCRRFYRVDQARDRSIEGTGLGLSICQAIAEAHHGTIAIDQPDEGGTRVVVSLPLTGVATKTSASQPSVEIQPSPEKTTVSGTRSVAGDSVRVFTQRVASS